MTPDLLPRARSLADLGERPMARELGITRHRARLLLNQIELEKRGTIATTAHAGSLYDTACRALAEAVMVDELKAVLDVSAAIRAYAKQAKNRELEANAAILRERAERKLGEKLIEAKAAGQISRGQPPKNSSNLEEFSRVNLIDVGIDHKLSSRAQRKAGIAAQAFDAMVDRMRDDIVSGRRSNDILKVHPINGARSVMGSRQEPDDSLDYFPTPPWATRALVERVLPHLEVFWERERDQISVKEPACGEGHIALVLREYFSIVGGSDIFDYGIGALVADFLKAPSDDDKAGWDWIITNPPFGDKAIAFLLRALDLARVGVAMFFRSQWAVEGIERYETIFRDRPPTLCAFFVERVNLCKGRWDPDGTTATAYCWLVWVKDRSPMPPFWIPPGQREALTKPDDRERFAAWSLEENRQVAE